MAELNATDLPRTPPTGDSGDQPGAPDGGAGPSGGQTDWPREDAPVGLRVGRNPANVGDEVADEGDLTFPETIPQTAEI